MEGLAVPFTAIADGINNLWDGIADFFENVIDLLNPASDNFFLKKAFVPTEPINEKFNDTVTTLKEKFPLINDIERVENEIIQEIENEVESEQGIGIMGTQNSNIPEFFISLPSKYGGTQVRIIDFTAFEYARGFIHTFILLVAYWKFMRRTIKRIPTIIHK